MAKISKKEFEEWKKENPITLAVFKYLLEQAHTRRYLVGSSAVIDREKSLQEIGEQTYKYLTQAEIYENIASGLEYEEIIDNEDNSVRGENFN